MLRLTKPLAVAALLTAAALPAHAEFGDTNMEKGCIILSLHIDTRIEQGSWRTASSCAKLKADTLAAVKGKDPNSEGGSPWFACTLTSIMARNRVRGTSDFDKPSVEVRRGITKACMMIMNDMDEDKATYVVNRGIKE